MGYVARDAQPSRGTCLCDTIGVMRVSRMVHVLDARDLHAESSCWAGLLDGTVDVDDWDVARSLEPAEPPPLASTRPASAVPPAMEEPYRCPLTACTSPFAQCAMGGQTKSIPC